MAIIQPEEMDFSNKNITMIIYGLPGVGKTTLALSAPDVLLIDCDKGMSRVNPEHRKASSICTTYEEVLADVREAKGKFKTVVIDTCGALIEMLKDWAMRTEPVTATKKSGGISMQGFGIVKSEFLRFSRELSDSFNVIYIFHAQKDKTNDDVFYELVCEGSTRTTVWQPSDLGAFCQIVNEERYLCFTPTMNYSAKSAYGIRGLIKVPELKEGEPNVFLTTLFKKVRENMKNEHTAIKPVNEEYEKVIREGSALIDTIVDAKTANDVRNALKDLPNVSTSGKELQTKFKAKITEVGVVWDKVTQTYVSNV